ncbi:MAG: TAXI family TRAP transporter solute-binding subunit [Rhodospirillaceae bacterium]
MSRFLLRRKTLALIPAAVLAAAVATSGLASAETRVTYKSAKSSSSYYQMAVQIAEAMKKGSNGAVIVTVEDSQGSVQNVMEAAARTGNYVFTTPPALGGLAQKGAAMFKVKENPKFADIRALFPIPSLTMHFVVRADSGIASLDDLAGRTLLIGKGSFGATEGAKYLGLFGLKDKVKLADVELNAAVAALKNKQIDGFITAGSYPTPNVIGAAASTGVKLLSLSDEQVAKTKRTRLVIPGGTYAGVGADTVTTSLPVVAYTTTGMDDATAYQLTKTYWAEKQAMGAANPWWNGVSAELLGNITGQIHPGALKYYAEAGMQVPASARGRRAAFRTDGRRNRDGGRGACGRRRLPHRADLLRIGAQPGRSAAANGARAALGVRLRRGAGLAAPQRRGAGGRRPHRLLLRRRQRGGAGRPVRVARRRRSDGDGGGAAGRRAGDGAPRHRLAAAAGRVTGSALRAVRRIPAR